MLEDVNKLIEDISESSDDIKEDLQLRKRLLILNIVEGASRMSSWLSVSFVIVIVVFSILFFLLAAAAFYLGELWNNMALGFLVIAGVYLVLSIFGLWLAHQKIRDLTSNVLIKMFLK